MESQKQDLNREKQEVSADLWKKGEILGKMGNVVICTKKITNFKKSCSHIPVFVLYYIYHYN